METNTSGSAPPPTTPGPNENVNAPLAALTITSTLPTTTQATQATSIVTPPPAAVSAHSVPNLITVPVPIVHNEENYVYVMIKGSLHDRSCSVFGLNDEERQALGKRFESIKPVVNGVMVSTSPVDMVNTLAQLNYKVICASGEAEICWTMQREI